MLPTDIALAEKGFDAVSQTYFGMTKIVRHYVNAEGIRIDREISESDMEIAFQGIIDSLCPSCLTDSRIQITVHADGNATYSKCGRCYL